MYFRGAEREGATMGKTRILGDIDPASWEHPADRAALAAVRQLKGVDELARILLSATTERSLRLLHLASSVKVTERQYPRIHRLMSEIVETFDWDYRPPVFITQNPFPNASVLGVREPFILLHSAVLRHFGDDEIKAILAHEMGHVMSGHALYKTLIWFLANLSLGALPLGNLAVTAITAVLSEWDRKSELTADRAELLAVQEETPSYHVLMRMAGAEDLSEVNLNEFFLQAKEFEDQKTVLDSIHKLLNQAWLSHPYPVVRLQELKSWAVSGAYQSILAGNYRRRGDPAPKLEEDFKEAADFYRQTAKKSDDPLVRIVNSVGEESEKAANDLGNKIKGFFDNP